MPTYQVSTGPIAIAASTTKTLVDLATPASITTTITKWWIASDATSAGTATSAIRVQVGTFNAAVTTHTAVSSSTVFWDWGSNGINSQSTIGINTTVEGAGTPLYYEEHVLGLTQSELIVWEPVARVVTVGAFWRIRVIPPAGIATTNLYAGVMWTE